MIGTEHHEPRQINPPCDGLDRIERSGRVEVGDDGPTGLRLGTEPQGEGGLAARDVPLERRRRRTRQATRPEDRIEGGEARRHDRIERRP